MEAGAHLPTLFPSRDKVGTTVAVQVAQLHPVRTRAMDLGIGRIHRVPPPKLFRKGVP